MAAQSNQRRFDSGVVDAMNYGELIGARFGSLVVLRVNRGAKNKHNTADCKCDCGEEGSHRLTRLRNGLSTQCHKCGAKSSWANRARSNSDDMASGRFFSGYVDNAKRRGLSFELSKEDCIALFTSPCSYCGIEPAKVRKARNREDGAAFNGIDRVDSSLGYIPSNCVSCCSECNLSKRDMSRDEFIAMAIRIARHQSI